MITLLEYAVAGFEKNPAGTLDTLSEWSLCCMAALRAKDVNCKTLIHLCTAKTIEKLLENWNLETTRPWTSVKKIEESIKTSLVTPMLYKVSELAERCENLKIEVANLKHLNQELEAEIIRLQNENRNKGKGRFFG